MLVLSWEKKNFFNLSKSCYKVHLLIQVNNFSNKECVCYLFHTKLISFVGQKNKELGFFEKLQLCVILYLQKVHGLTTTANQIGIYLFYFAIQEFFIMWQVYLIKTKHSKISWFKSSKLEDIFEQHRSQRRPTWDSVKNSKNLIAIVCWHHHNCNSPKTSPPWADRTWGYLSP